jgi:hypothetical protein
MLRKQYLVWVGLLVVLVAINIKLAAGTTGLQDPSCNKTCGYSSTPTLHDDSHRPCCLGSIFCHVSNCPFTVEGCSNQTPCTTCNDRCQVAQPGSPEDASQSIHFCQPTVGG